MENTNKLERSELWNEIYDIVKQIPRKETNEDAVDAPSATTSIEKLILSYKIKAEKLDELDYKILIPKQTKYEVTDLTKEKTEYNWGVKEQPKESIEEVAGNYAKPHINKGSRMIGFIDGYNYAKQILYTEDEMINFVEEYKEFSINSNKEVISFKKWFNKHKKQ